MIRNADEGELEEDDMQALGEEDGGYANEDGNPEEASVSQDAGAQAGALEQTTGHATAEETEQSSGPKPTTKPIPQSVPDVTCELVILPEGVSHVQLFPGAYTIGALKESFARSFKTTPNRVSLSTQNTAELPEAASLDEVAQIATRAQQAADSAFNRHHPVGSATNPLKLLIRIDIAVDTGGADEAKDEDPFPETAPVDVIRVDLGPVGEGEQTRNRIEYVKIVREHVLRPKPFLGGYRNKRTGLVMHHASSQTVRRRKDAGVVKFHRDTQTVATSTRSVQTSREMGVQTPRKNLFIDTEHDTFITPKPYFTAHQLSKLKHQCAIELQCFVRLCMARRQVARLREAREAAAAQLAELKQIEEAEKKREVARQTQRRMHPKTKDDFDTLHRELEAWRQNEVQRIKAAGLSEEETNFRLQEVLGKEVVVLQIIDRLRFQVAKENQEERTQRMLEKMSSVKAWSTSDGDIIEVETPFTRRARELVVLYKGLTNPRLTPVERTDVLLNVKYAVKEFDCQLTREIVELIEREDDLMRRGRSERSLSGLRKRIAQLFLDFIQTPQFNPEAVAFLKAPQQASAASTTADLRSAAKAK